MAAEQTSEAGGRGPVAFSLEHPDSFPATVVLCGASAGQFA